MQKATINLIKDLKKQKREKSSLLFLDNIKIIRDAISHGLQIKYLLVKDEEIATKIISQLGENVINEDKILLTNSSSIDILADSKTPQGVVCVADYTQNIVKKPKENFLVIDNLQDPGNVGTLIRSAYASGFNDIYLLDSVNLTNSKLIRSSVGSIFTANVMQLSTKEFVKLAKEWKISLLKADMNGKNIFEYQSNGQVGIVIGNEGQGVSKEIETLCKESVKIPMQNGIESLNAAVSGSIIMYQINKNKLS